MVPALTLLASRILPSPEWPQTHHVYQFKDGSYLSVADDGSLRPHIMHALSGETFYWAKGSGRALAERNGVGYTFLVDEGR